MILVMIPVFYTAQKGKIRLSRILCAATKDGLRVGQVATVITHTSTVTSSEAPSPALPLELYGFINYMSIGWLIL